MAKNKVLKRRAARLMGTARRLSRASGETAHLYSESRCAAGTWDQRRRVVIKAEVVRHSRRTPNTIRASSSLTSSNRRGICTRRSTAPEATSRIGSKSCSWAGNRPHQLHRFLANQLRGLLSAAAYVLYQELRLRAAQTAFRAAQVSTLREHLMKLGAWVRSSVRRIVIRRSRSRAAGLPPCSRARPRGSPPCRRIWLRLPRRRRCCPAEAGRRAHS